MLFAYAWASGLIEFGRCVPAGALELLAGEAATVKNKIHARARLARDDQSMTKRTQASCYSSSMR
jgi:hypothetical protein